MKDRVESSMHPTVFYTFAFTRAVPLYFQSSSEYLILHCTDVELHLSNVQYLCWKTLRTGVTI